MICPFSFIWLRTTVLVLAILYMPNLLVAAAPEYIKAAPVAGKRVSGPYIGIPLGGDAYITKKGGNATEKITDAGLTNWTDAASVVSVYFKFSNPGAAVLYLRMKAPEGRSKLRVKVLDKVFNITVPRSAIYDTVRIGSIEFQKPGYVKVDLQGVKRTGASFGEVSELIVQGEPFANALAFVEDNGNSRFHFGRRGPSVHLRYPQPAAFVDNTEWFYNEVEVPEGQDVLGSYFQVNGFAYGYFGIQVNSETERRILFSVWSPFHTDDPKSIPDSLRIRLVKKGLGVTTGEFGNEGSGGQSYRKYDWKAGVRYAFLLRAVPSPATNSTTFTAYFKEADADTWQLIASFERPQTNSGLSRLYSFLENFNPATGYQERYAYFTNQWLRSYDGKWQAVTEAVFTADDIANRGQRLDYDGGVKGAFFYLRNCGFFDDAGALGKTLTRKQDMAHPPVVDFETLP